ncbi:hypothetical protein SPAN111604_07805 [Sphingomonas antarctica]|uniref:hypothetical protein n=1 Tax=Sphingomonas antarctica TaxID=2040274 RepID=UPI0039E818F1
MNLFAIAMLASAAPAVPVPPMGPQILTNEEEVYFDREAGRTSAPWIGMRIELDGGTTFVDAFGKVVPAVRNEGSVISADKTGIVVTLAGGRKTALRRARPVTCWASIKKDTPKADGSEDWYFVKDVHLHDQGGRALVGDGVPGVKPVVLRLRDVTWTGSARSSNRPSLVLYIHTPDQPDHAVSYVWADPGAARLGVNLRWMQASCTIDGLERGATGSETKAN